MFKAQVRQLASKRAERFGLEIKRVTITVSNNRRRMSVALVRPPPPPRAPPGWSPWDFF
eukprot:COSAG04_NODE_24014_length_328_cov_1.048035_1_plen_58_part_10